MNDSTRAREAAMQIATRNSKPDIPVESYLAIGKFLSGLSASIPSTKLRGQKIKEDYPDFEALDPALRSNSRRLYEALNGDAAPAFLAALEVADIRDYYTSNPTVIIRDHRNKLQSA